MENKKLTRSNNRMLAGVCAGLADYFGWDVTVAQAKKIAFFGLGSSAAVAHDAMNSLETMRASSSWRLTAPLRRLLNLVRGH